MVFTGRLSLGLQTISIPLASFMKRNVMQKRRSPSTIVLSILRNFRKLSESGLAPSGCTSPFLRCNLLTPVVHLFYDVCRSFGGAILSTFSLEDRYQFKHAGNESKYTDQKEEIRLLSSKPVPTATFWAKKSSSSLLAMFLRIRSFW